MARASGGGEEAAGRRVSGDRAASSGHRRRPDRASGRERILASALQLFEEFGYRATSVETIASGAGVAKGSVYWHFKGKEDLLVAIVDREIERVKSRLVGMFGGKRYDPEAVISVAGDVTLWVNEGVDRIRTVVMGALLDAGGGPKARRLEQKLVTRSRRAYLEARDALSRAFEEVGTPAGLDPRTASMCLMACLGGLLHLVKVMDPPSVMPKELAAAVRELFLRPVKKRGRPPRRTAGGRPR